MTQHTFFHFSDCGVDPITGQGGDTAARILGAYATLGAENAQLIKSSLPIETAFQAATMAAGNAEIAAWFESIGFSAPSFILAVNNASRVSFGGKPNAEGAPLFYVQTPTPCSFVGYGLELWSWLDFFHGEFPIVYELKSWKRHRIPSLRSGCQFRSWLYLPAVHMALAQGTPLDEFEAVEVSLSRLDRAKEPNTMIILPPDEFWNGRFATATEFHSGATLSAGDFTAKFIPSITEEPVGARPEDLFFWPSSNLLPGGLTVFNLGRRWGKGGQRNKYAKEIIGKLRPGDIVTIDQI